MVVLALATAAKVVAAVVIVEAMVKVESRDDCPLSYVCYLVRYLKFHLRADMLLVTK